jgi:hypothetical protein
MNTCVVGGKLGENTEEYAVRRELFKFKKDHRIRALKEVKNSRISMIELYSCP